MPAWPAPRGLPLAVEALVSLGRTVDGWAQLDSLRAIEPGHSGIAWLEQRLGTRR